MSLKQRLQKDMIKAMKEKNKERLSVIRLAKAAIVNAEKEKTRELDEDEVIAVLSKEVKQRKDALSDYEKAGRQDIIDKINKEIEILLEYLPQQLTEDEIAEIVSQTIFEVGANSIKDMGKVMKELMPKLRGRADGKLVNKLVRQQLEA